MTTYKIRIPEDRASFAGGRYERLQYPAGELQIRLKPSEIPLVFEAERIQVVARMANVDVMELVLLSDAVLKLAGGGTPAELILPYLPYSRADRRFSEGDCHGLKMFGEVIGWLGYERIRTLDVHSYRAQKFVGNLVNVGARPFISKAIADICDNGGHPVVLLPDEGAQRYGLRGALQASKKRNPTTGELSGFEAPDHLDTLADGKHDVLIVDDICDGGGTFIGLAQEIVRTADGQCKNKNCAGTFDKSNHKRPKLYLYVTHGIFSKGLLELWKYFEKIYTTNSVFPVFPPSGPKLEVFDCEPTILGG